MLMNLTEDAKSKLNEMKKELGENQGLRLSLKNFTCCSYRFDIAVDEKKPEDEFFDIEGCPFLIEDELYELFDRFSVDYHDGGIRDGFEVDAYKRK